jgi:ADP-heptose:LPS heptosyltransferase
MKTFTQILGLPKGRPIIGINTGCGAVFPTKQWPRDNFMDLITILHEKTDSTLLLLGGPREREFNSFLLENCPQGALIDAGTKNNMTEFMGIIELCDLILSADSLAMHLAIGRKKPVIALIGPTSAAEIDLYGRGEKVVSPHPCAPCYRKECLHTTTCMRDIQPEQVFDAILRHLPQTNR